MILFLLACQGMQSPVSDTGVTVSESERSGYVGQLGSSEWPSDFPDEQDLGLIFGPRDIEIMFFV